MYFVTFYQKLSFILTQKLFISGQSQRSKIESDNSAVLVLYVVCSNKRETAKWELEIMIHPAPQAWRERI